MIGLLSRGGIPLGALIYGFALERITMHSTMMLATLPTMLVSVTILLSMLKVQEI